MVRALGTPGTTQAKNLFVPQVGHRHCGKPDAITVQSRMLLQSKTEQAQGQKS